jgi:chorismate dehydratase
MKMTEAIEQPQTSQKAQSQGASLMAPGSPFTSRSMRLGIIPFLNVQPLVWGLQGHHQLFPIPSNQMGRFLQEGKLDVAIAPVVAHFLNPDLQIIPIAAIGSHGPVKSIRILSHDPLQNIQKLFVDDRSQTSVLMARLILKKWFGVKKPEVKPVEMPAFHPEQVKPWEAALQFGDNALIPAPAGMTVTDLGEEWFFRTQKPFIHAVWMARDISIAREIETDLLNAKNEGIKHLEEIVSQYKGIFEFEHSMAKEYLEKNIRYQYGPEEINGQLEFQKLLKEEGLIP